MFHLISKKKLHPWHLKKDTKTFGMEKPAGLGESAVADHCRESQSPKEFFHVKFPFFRNLGPETHVFFFFRKQPALVLKNWRWGVFHCGHHDFWCGRRDQTGAVCNVTECFVGSQQYHLGGNFYHGMDGWDVLLTFVCCCKFEGWISSLVLFTIGDIKRGIP